MITNNILIVGVDGMIGGALMDHLERAGESVYGTYLLPEFAGENRSFLDLSSDLFSWRPPGSIRLAFLCAGITRLEDCRRDPVFSSRINVLGTATLAKILVDQGAFVVFLSSNQVFDGSKPFMEADYPYCPMTEYGRQKAEAERQLKKLGDSVAIVRLTKVIGPNSIFHQWTKALLAGETIHPFSDMVLAPVSLQSVVSILRLIGDRREGGIWQISGDRDISYAETAFELFKGYKSNNLIIPCSFLDITKDLESIPINTTLNMERIQIDIGITTSSIFLYQTIKKIWEK